MRDLKFRGKSKNNIWVYGYFMKNYHKQVFICDILEHDICDTFYAVDEKTIGQYTGLKDKNGIEIYEGDYILCEFLSGMLCKTIHQVHWSQRHGGFSLLNEKSGHAVFSLENVTSMSILGNKFDDDLEELYEKYKIRHG